MFMCLACKADIISFALNFIKAYKQRLGRQFRWWSACLACTVPRVLPPAPYVLGTVGMYTCNSSS